MFIFPPKTKLPSPVFLIVVSAVLALFIVPLYYESKISKLQAGSRVTDVFDGDTFKLKSGQRIRLKTADAPELNLCGGEEAKEKAKELVLGKIVSIEESILDRWGRWLGLVYVDGKLVDEAMIRSGWARYNYTKSLHAEELSAAAKYAQDNALGIHSQLCRQITNLKNPNCDIKGNIDPKKEAKVYHLPSCPEYERTIVALDKGEQWFCTEEEAIAAGFTRASACK